MKEKKYFNKIYYIVFFILFLTLIYLIKINIDYFLSSDANIKNIIELSYKKKILAKAVEENLVSDKDLQNIIDNSISDKKLTVKEFSDISKEYDLLLKSIPEHKLQVIIMNLKDNK